MAEIIKMVAMHGVTSSSEHFNPISLHGAKREQVMMPIRHVGL